MSEDEVRREVGNLLYEISKKGKDVINEFLASGSGRAYGACSGFIRRPLNYTGNKSCLAVAGVEDSQGSKMVWEPQTSWMQPSSCGTSQILLGRG